MWPTMRNLGLRSLAGAVIVATTIGAVWAQSAGPAATPAPAISRIDPATMTARGTVDPRFVSYNVEMVEVTGGRFWKPFNAEVEARLNASARPAPDAPRPVGMDPNLFQYRPPIDLANPRLRKLAAALGPAYMRVSGTWQNSTFFQDDDSPAMKEPPKGFNGAVTRAQWKGVVDFSHAVGAKLVTSVATSAGTRDAAGVWTPTQAKAVWDYTKRIGGSIAATEFMNEPTFAEMGGAPAGYDGAAFGRDVKVFGEFLRQASPDTVFLGPGSVGEGMSLVPAGSPMKLIATDAMMKASGPIYDAFSYHFYGTISRRCAAAVPHAGTTADQALTVEWLNRTDIVESFYAALRDMYLPGKPIWLTETAQAACGGDKWAATFVDTFRYVNQLGTLAQQGVKTVMHNTLASSDYGLLDEETLEPRPNYWAAVLWNRTMGVTVLDPHVAKDKDARVRVYAQCMKDANGGVSLLILNTDPTTAQTMTVPVDAERYTLTAPSLTGNPALSSNTVLLNGAKLTAMPDGSLPSIKGQPVKAGSIRFEPVSITFLTMPTAGNAVCR
jgi:heparanase 1